jgi:hypothetical protein
MHVVAAVALLQWQNTKKNARVAALLSCSGMFSNCLIK